MTDLNSKAISVADSMNFFGTNRTDSPMYGMGLEEGVYPESSSEKSVSWTETTSTVKLSNGKEMSSTEKLMLVREKIGSLVEAGAEAPAVESSLSEADASANLLSGGAN